MSNVSDGANDSPLSMEDAVKSYAGLTDEEVREDEPEQEAEHSDEPDTEDDEVESEEGEPEEEEQPSEDPEDDEEPVGDRRKVRLEDGTLVTVADLKKGTLLHADYTRKTQEVAQERRVITEHQAAIQQHAQQLQQTRDFTMAALQATMPPEPPPEMVHTDPIGYMHAERAHREVMTKLQHLHRQSQAFQSQQEEAAQQAHAERQEREKHLMIERMPDLKNPAKLAEFRSDIEKFAAHYGYSPSDFDMVIDHRTAAIVRDAMKYRKLQSAKPNTAKKVEGRPPVQRSGKRLNSEASAARESKAAMDRLNKTGSMKDAVQALLLSEKG